MDTTSKQKTSANGGQPTCETCGGSGVCSSEDGISDGRDVTNYPCPDCQSQDNGKVWACDKHKAETSANVARPKCKTSEFVPDWIAKAHEIAGLRKPDPNPSQREVVFWAAFQQSQWEKREAAEKDIDILAILQEADEALLEGKAAVVHSCLRQTIAELTE